MIYAGKIEFIIKNELGTFTENAVNVQYNSELLRFSWILSNSVTYKSGSVSAVIIFIGTESGHNYALKTVPFTINVDNSLDFLDIEPPHENWFVDIEARISDLENNGVNNENYVSVDSQDTPIGNIISYMGNTVPENYLICDGSEYNIVDYQELANHFIKEFGSVDYFGGNSETTFAVPDLRGEFLRGSGGNSHINQGSGANVGIHQDGTTINAVCSHPSGDNTILLGSKMNKSVRNADYALSNSGFREINIDYTTTSYSAINEFIPRPTNTSVLYCIKYKSTCFIKNEITDKRLGYTDISNELILSADVNISTMKAYIENGIVSIRLSVNFAKAGAITFANIPEKYAPREDTLGIFYDETAVMIDDEITFARISNNGSIYCYIDKKPSMVVTFQFTYPLKTDLR